MPRIDREPEASEAKDLEIDVGLQFVSDISWMLDFNSCGGGGRV